MNFDSSFCEYHIIKSKWIKKNIDINQQKMCKLKFITSSFFLHMFLQQSKKWSFKSKNKFYKEILGIFGLDENLFINWTYIKYFFRRKFLEII